MATREENLKKINDALEKLDDEQLDKIAGGNDYDGTMQGRIQIANAASENQNQNPAPAVAKWLWE